MEMVTIASYSLQPEAHLAKNLLEAEGIPTKTFALDPNRANLVARLKGNGSKRPLLLLAHTDVVPVQVEKWPVDPFGAVMKDGYIWVSEKPGWGIEVNEKEAAKSPFTGGRGNLNGGWGEIRRRDGTVIRP